MLAVLRGGEHYGFDLVSRLAEVDGMVTSEGTIYPLLTRLRRDGLVSTVWKESPKGRRAGTTGSRRRALAP